MSSNKLAISLIINILLGYIFVDQFTPWDFLLCLYLSYLLFHFLEEERKEKGQI